MDTCDALSSAISEQTARYRQLELIRGSWAQVRNALWRQIVAAIRRALTAASKGKGGYALSLGASPGELTLTEEGSDADPFPRAKVDTMHGLMRARLDEEQVHLELWAPSSGPRTPPIVVRCLAMPLETTDAATLRRLADTFVASFMADTLIKRSEGIDGSSPVAEAILRAVDALLSRRKTLDPVLQIAWDLLLERRGREEEGVLRARRNAEYMSKHLPVVHGALEELILARPEIQEILGRTPIVTALAMDARIEVHAEGQASGDPAMITLRFFDEQTPGDCGVSVMCHATPIPQWRTSDTGESLVLAALCSATARSLRDPRESDVVDAIAACAGAQWVNQRYLAAIRESARRAEDAAAA